MEGEAAWKTAVGLQQAVKERTGRTVPLSRAFADPQAGGPDAAALTWVIAGEGEGDGMPPAVQEALAEQANAPLVVVPVNGGVVAVLRSGVSLAALVRTFHQEPELYPTARQVR
jgi:hypothetical protein